MLALVIVNLRNMNTEDIIGVLNDLLTINHDAKEGYIEAGNDVDNRMLRKWLFNNSERRQIYIQTLEEQIHLFGGEANHGLSLLGTLHRAWIDFKSNVIDGDIAILEECIRGEQKALEDYDKFINQQYLPTSLKDILQIQRNGIAASLNSLETIEETYKVAG